MTSNDRAFLHLTATDRGGAGIAAVRIHRALLDEGHRSHMVVGHGDGGEGITVHRARSAMIARTASKAVFRTATRPRFYFRNQRHDVPGASQTVASTIRRKNWRPNAIIAHTLTDFLSFPAIARLAKDNNAHVIWSLMDMGTFTGGCHYAWECSNYEVLCGGCPALRLGAGPNDWSVRTLREKRAALAEMNATVVAPSTWLANQARASVLFRDTPIEIIPLSVSPETFAPRERATLRANLGIEMSRPAVFFGARDHRDPRKGMALLEEALIRLAQRSPPDMLPSLLVAGDGAPFEALVGYGYSVRQFGLLKPDTLAQVYAAADVFVSPSIEDSGPMMINEAVMSGTRVVSFPVGVALDLIEPDITGIFATLGDAGSLAAAIAATLAWDRSRAETGSQRARQIGLEHCSPKAQADAFVRVASAPITRSVK
ncbi:glycosyltransferase [Erythrobacter sp. A6_0]|uniref:glycosyltransferase n=1 Tax=Erythrobacter sp. A6_0 TaxID=2821089 RepID=UPI001AD99C87|nr:glycosyltransferase [Erythrobacter sp. A6_0]MBO9511896.1 glycosyltransferase [Erythrobacter sp. A6_0]